MLIDSHCHIHDDDFPIPTEVVLANMLESGVLKAICVGLDVKNSIEAVDFAKKETSPQIKLFSSVGIHPHEAKDFNQNQLEELENLLKNNAINSPEKVNQGGEIVAIGEIGLDYFYENSPKEAQIKALKAQLELAKKWGLPVIFHVRNAFDDFWKVLDEFEQQNGKITGVIHSFTDNKAHLNEALKRDFFIGVNGISTFVKNPEELEMFASIPLEKTLLETDSPFLAPIGKRGQKNQPTYVEIVAQIASERLNKTIEEVENTTSKNCEKLFNI